MLKKCTYNSQYYAQVEPIKMLTETNMRLSYTIVKYQLLIVYNM